ncbi:MAG: heme biosynthesis HemY N-terminal domain-containing protein [Succinivibrio sp.]
MIKLLVFLAITCIAVILGPMLADTQGFVHISTRQHIIETSITTALLIYVFSVLVLFIIYIVTKKLFSIPHGTLQAFRLRSVKKKLTLQDEAIICFEQGQYENALALLKHANPIKKMPERSLLIAAQAAFHIGLYDFTRQALDEAQNRGRQTKIAADVVRARLNYQVGNSKAALEYLDNTASNVKNKAVLNLYLECYLKEGKLDKIVELSPQLIKFNVITQEQARGYYIRHIENCLKDAKTLDEIEQVTKVITKNDKHDPRIMGAVAYKLIKLGDANKAKEITLDLLKRSQDPSLLESIANWDIAIPDVLVALKKYASHNIITTQVNLPLLKAMANLEYKSGLLREALDDYKQALTIEQTPDIYLKMGVIFNNLQNYPDATECYSKAVALMDESKALSLKN